MTPQPLFEFVTSVPKRDLRAHLTGTHDDDVLTLIHTDQSIPDFVRPDVIRIARQRAEQSGFEVDRIVKFEDFPGQNLSAGRVTLLVHQQETPT